MYCTIIKRCLSGDCFGLFFFLYTYLGLKKNFPSQERYLKTERVNSHLVF